MRPAAALLLASALALPCAAQDVAFKVTPPGGKLKLTDKFKVRVEASPPPGYAVAPDTASPDTTDFEILSFEKIGSGPGPQVYEITAQAFALGPSSFPVIAWNLLGGAEAAKARSPGFELDIGPLFEASEEDGIRDIYPPFRFPPWLLIALAAAALAALARHIYEKYRSRTVQAQAAAWRDDRPPYQRALDRLDRLAASRLVPEGLMKEYYIGLTSILRLYLFEEFALRAELMTTSDLARELKKTGADLKTSLKTREFLQKADLVKFARLRPENAEADTAELRELVGEYTRTMERNRAAAAAASAPAAAGGRP